MRLRSIFLSAGLGIGALASTACLDLGLSPTVGGVLQSVVVEGEALAEFARASGGSGTVQVTGYIVGRLRCDTVQGDVTTSGQDLMLTITVVSGRQGCNSLRPTTLSYAANIFNLPAGSTGVTVEHRYEGLDGPTGVRTDTVVVVG